MIGLFGFQKSISYESSEFLIQKIVKTVIRNSHEQHSICVQEGFGVAHINLEFVKDDTQPVWNQEKTTAAFFIGEIFNRKDIITKYQLPVSESDQVSDTQIISLLFDKVGNSFAIDLNGPFLLLIWEKNKSKITIINDRLGLFPLYFAKVNHGVIFGTSIQGCLVDPEIPKEPDKTAIAEFLIFDHMLDQHTLVKAIKLLPQSSVMEIENNEVICRPYYKFEFLKHHSLKTDEAYIEEFIFYMRQAIKRQIDSKYPIGLLLSGGLDSRFLLAIMAENKEIDLNTFTWSIPGSDDSRYSLETARKAHTQHHFFELKPDWLLDKAEKAILLTSGNGNIVNLHAFATLEEEVNIANVIFKGFMGDAMFGFGIRPRFWADYDPDTMIEQHIEAYRDYRVLTIDPKDHQSYFTEPFFRETKDEWKEEFRTGMLACGCGQMTDHRSYFDLTQRVPRMTINGVDVVRDRAIVRLPFTDNDLVEFSLTIPPHLRYKRELMNRTFICYFPEYAKIPIAQTQLPMMHCARELWIRNKQFIQWHLRNRGLDKLAGPVSKPYKDYNKWFRTNLKHWVEETLLDSRTLNRGYLKPEEIKKIVTDHMAGKNNAVRIGALMSIELSHRLFLD
ncbi:MAG: asparagine synthetase B family protein [Anaerolineaceae bacterium]